MKLIDQLNAAARCGVPLVGISTPDPAETIRLIVEHVKTQESPKIAWDMVRGFRPLNECQPNVGRGECANNPLEAVKMALNVPGESIIVMQMANRFMSMVPFIQAVWNCRDEFKGNGRMLILLGPDLDLPPELVRDVVMLDEPLPNDQQLELIISDLATSAGIECNAEVTKEAINATRGLAAFEAEQVVAMSITKEGLSVSDCWARKRKAIEKTKGLSVHMEGKRFEEIAGLDQVKRYLKGIMSGPMRPNAVVWIDEVEKSGLAHTGDMSGVNSDQLGTMLTYMEDRKATGVMLVGVPGCGKSEICKSIAAEFQVLVIRMDMGEMQGSLVGQSQQQLRQALKTIDAVAGDRVMFVATSNSIANLDTALKSRFPDVFFFDLPTEEQIEQAWKIHGQAFGIADQPSPECSGWSGRNVQRCCQKAYSMSMTLIEASEFIIPESVQSAKEIQELRSGAIGKYLSTEYSGAYHDPSIANAKAAKVRRISNAN